MDYSLHVFTRVAEQQSISAAARALHLTQPAVTHQIKRLEEEYRTSLFIRSRSGVALTEDGLALLQHARRVASLEEEIAGRIGGRSNVLRGRLRVGSSTTVTQYFLPAPLTAFRKRHPEVGVEIVDGNSDAIISALLDQRIDLGLIEAPCRRRDLRVQPFFDDEIIPIAPPGHPLAGHRSLRPADLAAHPIVFREHGSGTRLFIERALAAARIDPRRLDIVQELSSTEAIKRAVHHGLGLGFVPLIALRHELADASLIRLRVRDLDIHRPFSVILPHGADPVGLRQIFLGFLR